MKNESFATLGLLALLAVTPTFGQQMTANIPFDFRVGTSLMPAGKYDVSRLYGGSAMRVSCFERRAHATAITFHLGGGGLFHNKGSLVFQKYGNAYFLSEAWSAGSNVGNGWPTSKAEREVARNALLASTALSIPLEQTSKIARR